jgi:hypothetical protein
MLDKVNNTPEEDYAPLMRQDARIFRLAVLMKQRNLSSVGQLETVLRANGSSLRKQQDAFGETLLGQSMFREAIDVDPEVTHQEMQEYYLRNEDEFFNPARAKWEQITIRFSRCESREQALEQINSLGNELLFGGTPFWAVARRHSHGAKAADNGFHDWTEQGDLEISNAISDAVFSFPLNRLSPVIADGEGYHIVRVLDRIDAHVTPFAEAQVEIKQRLQNKKRSEAMTKYVARLKEEIPVW